MADADEPTMLGVRRSTRARRKPQPVYEVADLRSPAMRRGSTTGGNSDGEEEDEQDEEQDAEDDGGGGKDGDEEEEEEEEGEEDGEEEEAFEPEQKKKRSKPLAGQRKSAASVTVAKRRKVVSKGRKPQALKPVVEERPGDQIDQMGHDDAMGTGSDEEAGGRGDNEGDDDDMLFELVKEGRVSMRDVMMEWRDRFEEDSDTATREVLHFLLQSCGGVGQCIPRTEQLDQLDMGDVVNLIVADLTKAKSTYPIAPRSKGSRRFRTHFGEFWDALVKECYESELLFTSEVVLQFIDWLTTLSSAEVRAIRHTSTVAVYALGTAMLECVGTITQQLSVTQRQLNAETSSSQRTQRSPTSRKFEQLKRNKVMYENRRAKLLESISLVFNGVVVHRYRDVMPEIRLESIQTLGNWITIYPDQFLKDNYLKYLGWMLNDKVAHVRLGVLEILLRLYEEEAFAEKLELFTARFLPRFLEICNDVDNAVVHACIMLLIAVDKRKLISSNIELHSVEKLVFDEDNEEIRKAAAEFVCLQYDAFGVAESKSSQNLTREQLHTQAIALVEFAEEYVVNHGVPAEAVETMVDAFWGLPDCQVLQDWRLLTNLLMQDKNVPDLTNEQQTLLIRLLVSSLEKIVSDGVEKTTTEMKKKIAKDKEEIAITFCKEIPNFLIRFQSDTEKLSLIVELIPLLTLSANVNGLQATYVTSLLEKLKQAYMAHSEEGLLQSLSISIHHLLKSDHEVIKRESDIIVHELCQELLDQLEEVLSDDSGTMVEHDIEKSKRKRRSSLAKGLADTEYAVRIALARIACLITHTSIRQYLPQVKNVYAPHIGNTVTENANEDNPTGMSDRMTALTSALVDLIGRRSKNVLQLHEAFLNPDTIKYALTVLYTDLLWLIRPIFTKPQDLELQNGIEGEGPVSLNIAAMALVRKVQQSRVLLEQALTSVLEMHLVKTQAPRDSEYDDPKPESQITMEEIEFDNIMIESYVREGQRAAYFTFCDARCVFVEKFQNSSPPYDALEWTLPKVLVLLTQMYFENEMETNEDDQPEGEESAINEDILKQRANNEEALQLRKAEVLVALGRLSNCNPHNKRQAAAVIRCLTDPGAHVQEVVKAFGKHVKAESPVRYLEIQMTALRQVYSSVLGMKEELETTDNDEAAQEELQEGIETMESELKDLGKKLSQSLGVGKVAASLRAPFFRFLCEGVRYSLERPLQFSFLEALRPYVSHVDKSSAKQLNAYLTQLLQCISETPKEGDDIDDAWQIVFNFQASITASNNGGPTVSKSLVRQVVSAGEDRAGNGIATPTNGDRSEQDGLGGVDKENEALQDDPQEISHKTPPRKRRNVSPGTRSPSKRSRNLSDGEMDDVVNEGDDQVNEKSSTKRPNPDMDENVIEDVVPEEPTADSGRDEEASVGQWRLSRTRRRSRASSSPAQPAQRKRTRLSESERSQGGERRGSRINDGGHSDAPPPDTATDETNTEDVELLPRRSQRPRRANA